MGPSSTSATQYDSAEERNQSVTKLPLLTENGENFVSWKAEVEAAITAKGLLRYLDGRATEPIMPPHQPHSTDDAVNEAYKKSLEEYDDAYDTWVQKNAQIKNIFYCTVPATLKLQLHALKSAKEAWDKICSEHQRNEPLSQVNLLTSMSELRTDDGQDPRETLNRYLDLKSRYANAGGIMASAQETAIILKFLPKSYRPSILPLFGEAARNKTTVKSEDLLATVKALAANEEYLDKSTGSSAYAARGAKGNSGGKRDKSKDKCANCGKLGHWKEDCWAEGGGKIR